MKSYFALSFKLNTLPNHPQTETPTLKSWLVREQSPIQSSQALFKYQVNGEEKEFLSPIEGIFKAFLCKEGETLTESNFIGVLEVSSEVLAQALNSGLGQCITPDEAQKGMSYVEAASIRMPS